MSDEPRQGTSQRLVPIISGFIVSIAAGILVLAFEKELRSLTRTGALGLAAGLLAIAVLSVAAPSLSRLSARLRQLPSQAAFVASETLLYFAPLFFVLATLIIVYATKPVANDLLAFLEPFGPVLAGCGGAISIVAAAATDVIYRRDFVWRKIRFQSLMALFLVAAASGFNRFGYALEAWGVGLVAMNSGIFDVHRQFFRMASLISTMNPGKQQHHKSTAPSKRRGRR